MDQVGSEEVKEEKPRRKPVPAPVAPKPETLIYVGPNLPGGTLVQYTTFRGGLPAHVEKLASERPAIKKLLIPVDKLSAFVSRSATPGTAEHRNYQDVLGGM